MLHALRCHTRSTERPQLGQALPGEPKLKHGCARRTVSAVPLGLDSTRWNRRMLHLQNPACSSLVDGQHGMQQRSSMGKYCAARGSLLTKLDDTPCIDVRFDCNILFRCDLVVLNLNMGLKFKNIYDLLYLLLLCICKIFVLSISTLEKYSLSWICIWD